MASARICSPVRESLFSVADYRMDGITPPGYDVTRDDQRFVMMRIGEEGETGTELILVENFLEELGERGGATDPKQP